MVEALLERSIPDPVVAGVDDDGVRWWAAGIPFENRAALLPIADEDADGTVTHAILQLLLPAPTGRWRERLEATPCVVVDRHIQPSLPPTVCPDLPAEWDWLLTDGWWARVDDAAEILRYVDLFGTMPVAV